MGTASQFDKILKQELNIHAAWIPVTNTFALGDFGLVSDGVLVRMGNIQADFGVKFESAPGQESTLNFSSKGTTMVRVSGGAVVNAFPENNAEAKLTIEFGSESSFLVKATLSVVEMQNLLAVAKKLDDTLGWERKYSVVSAIYKGENCAIISSKSNNSKIELAGKADALKQFDIGSVAANIEVSNKQDIGLDLVGRSGVIGLALFKLSWLDGSPKTLAGNVKIHKSTDNDWPATLPDDL